MSTASQRSTPTSRVSIRSIALPTEHGGWGFTLEPILLGLLVAYSAAAWELSVAALAVFLARRPFRLLMTDLVRRRWLRRTSVAASFAFGYGLLALLGLVGALVTAPSRFLLAYVAAAPFAAVALVADTKSKSRTLVAELAGSIAMGATATAIALADWWAVGEAFGLWLVLAGRAVATIALVRGQIRRVHDKPVRPAAIHATQAATVATMALAALLGFVPWLAVVAMAGIWLLAVISLRRPPVPARVVGWTQMATGLAVVVLTAAGVWMDW
ncbi:MAG: YwiC-like family protein [Acidimicrobiia bacterium]|nr:YwiC-like family protein [Acidimicrobiia bacterium]